MRKLIVIFSIIFACNYLSAQTPDVIKVSIKSTLATFKDCVIKVEISRIDHQAFMFPSNYSIGKDNDLTNDLFIVIEKKEGGKYRGYMCKYLSAHMDALSGDSIKYKKFTKFILSDSLEDIGCLDSGKYRLRIQYNKRKTNGEIDLPDIVTSSDWAYFFVKSDEILLWRYWLRSGAPK